MHATSTLILPQNRSKPQRREEPLILSRSEALLKHLLDILPRLLSLTDLLEGVVGHGALEAFEFEGVAGGH